MGIGRIFRCVRLPTNRSLYKIDHVKDNPGLTRRALFHLDSRPAGFGSNNGRVSFFQKSSHVSNFAQTRVSDRLRLISTDASYVPPDSKHPRTPADYPLVGWRLPRVMVAFASRAPHYGAFSQPEWDHDCPEFAVH